MSRSLHSRLARLVAALTVVVTVALGTALPATADDWGRDRAAVIAYEALDPAIRTALAARAPDSPVPPPATVSASHADDGFAWNAAAIGFAVAIAGVCIALGCVTLVRHDGRLRNA
ncbi:MAG TPA: hypothetical protein VHH57_02545 [Gaiella sp.]|jgi:hypothetical protein|nr:hypothetical protein [Gaiella sp.]